MNNPDPDRILIIRRPSTGRSDAGAPGLPPTAAQDASVAPITYVDPEWQTKGDAAAFPVLSEHEARCALVGAVGQVEACVPDGPADINVTALLRSDGAVQSVRVEGGQPEEIRGCVQRVMTAWTSPVPVAFPLVFAQVVLPVRRADRRDGLNLRAAIMRSLCTPLESPGVRVTH
jgi:hypothetical protein